MKTPRPITAPWTNDVMRERSLLGGRGATHKPVAQASRSPRVLVTHRSAIARGPGEKVFL